MSGNVDVTNMQWRPQLIQLTQIEIPDLDNGKDTVCYVDPSNIAAIHRCFGSFMKKEGEGYHPRVECTFINCCHFHLLVKETPQQVAMLRDKAFGYKYGPEK